jgi:hypothetical protein
MRLMTCFLPESEMFMPKDTEAAVCQPKAVEQKTSRSAVKDRPVEQQSSRAAVFNKENHLYLNLTTALLPTALLLCFVDQETKQDILKHIQKEKLLRELMKKAEGSPENRRFSGV